MWLALSPRREVPVAGFPIRTGQGEPSQLLAFSLRGLSFSGDFDELQTKQIRIRGLWLFYDLGSEAWPGTFTLRVDSRVDAPKRTLALRKVTALKVEAVSGYRGKGLSNFSLTLSQNDWFREDNDSNGKEKLLFRVRTELHNAAK